jgi:magnesium chelatase family protein
MPEQARFCLYPCPCGYHGDPVKECTCSWSMVSRYQKRISGPLLDRSDIHIEVPRVEYEKLTDERLGEPSADIQARVEAARERPCKLDSRWSQRQRFDGTDLMSNADMGPAEVRSYCQIDDAGKNLLRAAMHQLQMRVPSTRGACPGRKARERPGLPPYPQAVSHHRLSCLSGQSRGAPRGGTSTGEHRRADLAGSEGIETAHLAEAIQYRPRRQT